ncbi:MAG: HPr(Ser) kinase/phosphatase [Tissierellia bacterium]|nr:HPr(Ser) kinase/phosphatase [Tissierellia bacterium]
MNNKSISIAKLAEKLNMEVIIKSSDYETKTINNDEVNRPGLQLAGYLEGFPYKRLQIIGKVEYEYYMDLSPDERYERIRGIFSYPIPAIIFSHGKELTEDIIDLARYFNKTVLRSELPTTRLISRIANILDELLAEEVTVHADLLEVYGMGVLITGDSSVGKSETALDLITRGHRLVADDVVDIIKLDAGLKGSCPENIRHFLEIRGIGIIDIQRLYGVGSVKTSTIIDMVIHLEQWDDNKEYDRLGLDDEYTEILGVKIPIINVPVKPGRNVAMIVEVAIRNTRQKSLGYNAAVELNNRLIAEMQKKPQ